MFQYLQKNIDGSHSQLHAALDDFGVHLFVNLNVLKVLRVENKKRILDDVGTEALFLESHFGQLVGGGHFQLVDDANKNRNHKHWQTLAQFGQQLVEIVGTVLVENGGHTGLSLAAGHLHPVHDAIGELEIIANDGLHLHGGHILSLPPVGVTTPVLEVEITKLVHCKQISRGKSTVSFAENIEQNLLLVRLLVRVTIERSGRVIGDNLANKLASLARLHLHTQAFLVSNRLIRVLVHFDQRGRVDEWGDLRDESTGAFFVIHINYRGG